MSRDAPTTAEKLNDTKEHLAEALKATMYVKATQIPQILTEPADELVTNVRYYVEEVMQSLSTGIGNSDSIRTAEDLTSSPAIFVIVVVATLVLTSTQPVRSRV